MRIEKIIENKKQYLDLLLLADEEEKMIDKYLPDGDLFALFDDDLKSVCVVVPVNSESCGCSIENRFENALGRRPDTPQMSKVSGTPSRQSDQRKLLPAG